MDSLDFQHEQGDEHTFLRIKTFVRDDKTYHEIHGIFKDEWLDSQGKESSFILDAVLDAYLFLQANRKKVKK